MRLPRLAAAALLGMGLALTSPADAARREADGVWAGEPACRGCIRHGLWLTVEPAPAGARHRWRIAERERERRGEGRIRRADGTFELAPGLRLKRLGERRARLETPDGQVIEMKHLERWRAGGRELILDPQRLRQGGAAGRRWVEIDGMLNFDRVAEAGQRAIIATWRFDCRTRLVTMNRVIYHARPWALDAPVHEVRDPDNPPQPLGARGVDPLRDFADARCAANRPH